MSWVLWCQIVLLMVIFSLLIVGTHSSIIKKRSVVDITTEQMRQKGLQHNANPNQ